MRMAKRRLEVILTRDKSKKTNSSKMKSQLGPTLKFTSVYACYYLLMRKIILCNLIEFGIILVTIVIVSNIQYVYVTFPPATNGGQCFP